jgi:plastocyanin
MNPTEGHVINGKHTKPGDKVHYTASDGQKHEATVDSLFGSSANLTAKVKGQPQKFTSVPHSAVGGTHTWDHAPSED